MKRIHGPMAGRTVLILVTGAASGIGRATVLGLTAADLSSQGQVRRLASEVLERLRRIHVLVNNVGGYWSTRHVTVDGLERTFAQLRPGGSGTALGGELGSGQPHRGAPCVRSPATA
jgi:retinol dehydrogenase 14